MRHFPGLVGVAALAVACGGSTGLETGRAGADGGMGTGGQSSGAGGRQPGSGGISAGGVVGRGGAGGMGAGGKGGAAGAGAAASTGGAPGGQCTSSTACAAPAICQACPDGTSACASARCVGGRCEVLYPSCGSSTCNPVACPTDGSGKPCCLVPGGSCGLDYGMGCVPPRANQCVADRDCPPVPGVCQPCPDGSCAPQWTRCIGGACRSGIDGCPAPAVLRWWQTCGGGCVINPPPPGYAKCGPGEAPGAPCSRPGQLCDRGLSCTGPLQCAATDPTGGGVCAL
jgi:hypothetical protein